MGDKEDQLMVVRGVCANQKSARSRSPASNCDCEIIASPLRFLRRRSHGDRAFVGVKLILAHGLTPRGFVPAGMLPRLAGWSGGKGRVVSAGTTHSRRSGARSKMGSSQRPSMTPQACATVVRSRSKSHPVSVSDNPQPTRKAHGDLARQCHLCPSA
jgi:hypothetical protein